MTAAEVQPFQRGERVRDPGLQRGPDALQRLEPLFAQGVEMQTVDPLQMFRLQLRHGEAQPRAELAGIVFGDLGLGMFGIKAKADVESLAGRAGGRDQVGEVGDLGRGVEDHRIRQAQNLRQVVGLVGGGVGGQVSLVELPGQPRLPQARGADAVQILLDEVGQRPHRKGFQRQQDPCAPRRPDVLEDAEIATDRRLVDDETGRRHAAEIEAGEGAGPARLRFHGAGGRVHRTVPVRTREARPAPGPSRAGRACSACP